MSKHVSFKRKQVTGLSLGVSWIPHTIDMITADKWRALSLNCRRLLDRLEVEHMAHKGQDNGRLKISYSQFVQWGIGLLVDGFIAAGWDTVASFRGAMGVLLAACVFGYGWFLLAKDNQAELNAIQ